MLVYRLCKERYSAHVLSGEGGMDADGRWHSRGRRIVYCATAEALAVLELRVHVGRFIPAAAYVMHEIEVPDDSLERLDGSALPGDWRAVPQGAATQTLGDDWLRSGRSLALRVPSIHSTSDENVLVNPLHPQAARTRVLARRPYVFDRRLF